MKHRIMEAILSAENNLSQEEIVWAMHNIPNDNTASTPSRKFDHEKTVSLKHVVSTTRIVRISEQNLISSMRLPKGLVSHNLLRQSLHVVQKTCVVIWL